MSGPAKVTTRMVVAIREERADGGWTLGEIAARHGVSPMTVSRITTGDAHAHLPGPIVPKRHVAPQKECWRGHNLATNRITYTNFSGCKKCKQIRNKEYMRKRRATAP